MGNSAVVNGKEKTAIESAAHSSVFNPLSHPISLTYPALIATSGWLGHVPFGMYLIDVLRPNALVELGTHQGVSYSALCQAVKELGLQTRCYAIDTWQGDAHSGFYGSEVLTDLEEYHNPLYGAFSHLIQSTFDEALEYFPDHTFDLLHIDGFHTYQAVKQDFEKWLPKLTDRGVVLLHDINVRERDFGVWKLWEELKLRFPHFEFVHSHGLGVVAVGGRYPDELDQLFQCPPEEETRIRSFFSYLGARIEVAQELKTLKSASHEQSGIQGSWQEQARRTEKEIASQRAAYEAQVRRTEKEMVAQKASYEAELARRSEELRKVRATYEKEIHDQNKELNQSRAGYEKQINRQKDELKKVRAAYEEQIQLQMDEFGKARSAFAAQLALQASEFSNARESTEAQWIELHNVLRARDESIALLQNELANSEEKNRWLSAQLSTKTQAVDQITRSLGWRLLSRYGRVKYRYLLPLYRRLGLSQSRSREGDGDELNSEYQTAPVSQPPITQNDNAAQESPGQAAEIEEKSVALKSNSSDRVSHCVNEQPEPPATITEQQTDLQALPTTEEELSGAGYKLPVLDMKLSQGQEIFAQAQAQILAAEGESHYHTPLSETNAQITKTAEESSAIDQHLQEMAEVIAEFQRRMARDPSILDWNSGLQLAVSFPQVAVFSPLLSESIESTLPYLDHSIDMVVTSSSDPQRLSEARRVAAIAIIHSNIPPDDLRILTPGKPDRSQVTLGIEWLVDQARASSMPLTSIIIPVFNKVSYTQSCLQQLSKTLPPYFNGEIIVVDDASSDGTADLLEQWACADERNKTLRNSENLGFVTSCNRGAEFAQGDILIFINNDTLPLAGWLPPLLHILRDKPEAGAVGGKLVYPDGTLQEAGGVIFSDGQGCNFGKLDKAANAPLYNFLREVDYCSGALLATRRALFMELGGFDTRFIPAYYEDVDYCFSLRERGYCVYYQPESVIVHFEGISSGTDLETGVKSHQVANRIRFLEKWQEKLKHHHPAPDQYDLTTLHTLSRRNASVNGNGN